MAITNASGPYMQNCLCKVVARKLLQVAEMLQSGWTQAEISLSTSVSESRWKCLHACFLQPRGRLKSLCTSFSCALGADFKQTLKKYSSNDYSTIVSLASVSITATEHNSGFSQTEAKMSKCQIQYKYSNCTDAHASDL